MRGCGQWDRIVRLDGSIDIDGFSCGVPEMDIWFHRSALEQQEEHGCTVYVAVTSDDVIVGFFTLSMHYLQRRVVPEDVRKGIGLTGNIPCVLLGRLGVDSRFRGAEYRRQGGVPQGPLLVREAMERARIIADCVGCRLMYVQAKNTGLVEWYRRQGFTSLPGNPRNMVLDLNARRSDGAKRNTR